MKLQSDGDGMEKHGLVEEPYTLRVKAPPESLCSCCQAVEPFEFSSQHRHLLGWEASLVIFDGSAPAAPGMDVLQGGQRAALGCSDPSARLYGPVAKP